MIRRRFLRDLEAVARGEDPKAVIRDPALNRRIRLPVADRAPLIEGLTRAEMLRDPLSRRGLEGYVFQTGQPPEVRAAFLAAMGFNGAEFAVSDDPSRSARPGPALNGAATREPQFTGGFCLPREAIGPSISSARGPAAAAVSPSNPPCAGPPVRPFAAGAFDPSSCHASC